MAHAKQCQELNDCGCDALRTDKKFQSNGIFFLRLSVLDCAHELSRVRGSLGHESMPYSDRTLVGAWQASREECGGVFSLCAGAAPLSLPSIRHAPPLPARPPMRVGLISANSLAEAAFSYAAFATPVTMSEHLPAETAIFTPPSISARTALDVSAGGANSADIDCSVAAAYAATTAAGGAPAQHMDRGKGAVPQLHASLELGDASLPFPRRRVPERSEAVCQTTSLPMSTSSSFNLAPQGAAHGRLAAAASASSFSRESWKKSGKHVFDDD